MKYDIIYDDSQARWFRERSQEIYEIIKSWVNEYADEFGKKPEKAELKLGLDTWEWLSSHPLYKPFIGITIYNLTVNVPEPDWGLHNKYIELNLE